MEPVVRIGISAILLLVVEKASSKYCDNGHRCSPPNECCPNGCCLIYATPDFPPQTPLAPYLYNLAIWNHWYFWFVLLFLVVSCFGGCGFWRRRRALCGSRNSGSIPELPDTDSDSGVFYPPPNYSRCGSFPTPPAYNEVTSKPDLYPLVISLTDGEAAIVGDAKSAAYFAVHYFPRFLVRPVQGSLSATSTPDSLSSSFFCNSTYEANTAIPPPYPAATIPGGLLSSSLVSVSSLASPASPQLGYSGSELSSIGPGSPCSPPRATTPTLPTESDTELRDILDKIQRLPYREMSRPQTPSSPHPLLSPHPPTVSIPRSLSAGHEVPPLSFVRASFRRSRRSCLSSRSPSALTYEPIWSPSLPSPASPPQVRPLKQTHTTDAFRRITCGKSRSAPVTPSSPGCPLLEPYPIDEDNPT